MVSSRLPLSAFCAIVLSCLFIGPVVAASGELFDSLRLDGKHFDQRILTFSETKKLSLLEQYFRKNVEKHAAIPGATLEIVRDAYRKDLAHLEPAKRVELVDGWLEALEKDKLLTAGHRCFAQTLLRLLRCIEATDATKADSPELVELQSYLGKSLETHPKEAWLHLVAACAHDLLSLRKIPPTFGGDMVGSLSKAALLSAEDAQLHYVLGHVFSTRLNPIDDPGEFVKKVATEFEKCLLIEPSNKELLTAITGIYFDVHERYQSLSLPEPFWFEEMVYKRIINLDPTNARAHNNLAFLYTTYGVNPKEALRSAQIANQLKPNNPYLLDTLGWAHYKNRNLREALAILRKADELKSDLPDVQFHLASVYYDMDDFPNAVTHFRKTIALDPRNAFAKNNLAYLFSEKNSNLEEALSLVSEALALMPKNPAFVDTKGWILHRLGRHREAVTELELAVRLAPETSELHLHLGEAYLVLGRHDEAVRQFELAQSYDPKNKEISRDLAYVFAAHALESSLKNYARIGGASRSKANYKIFFDLLAHLHQLRGDSSTAISVLQRYQGQEEGKIPSLRPGDAEATVPVKKDEAAEPPDDLDLPASETPTVPTSNGELPSSSSPAEELRAAQVESCLSLFSPETNVILALESGGVSKIADMVLARVQTRIPAGALKSMLADKLPVRLLTGFQYVEGSKEARYLVALQLPPSAFDAYEERLAQIDGTQVSVPTGSATVTLRFGKHTTHDRVTIRKIETNGGRIIYFDLRRPYVVAGGSAEAVAQAIKRAEVTEACGLATDDMARKLLGVVQANSDAFSLVDLARMKIENLKLPESVQPLVKRLSAVAAAYEITESNCLLERAVIRSAGEPQELIDGLEKLAEAFGAQLSTDGVDAQLISHFEGSGPAEIRAELKLIGFDAFLSWILNKIGGLGLPNLKFDTP